MGTLKVLFITTSYPVPTNPISGIFIARLVKHLRNHVSVTVLTPAPQDLSLAVEADPEVQFFKYAPKKLQILAHAPGGIPVTLKLQKWSVMLLPTFLLSMTNNCFWLARKSQILHANWTICGCIAAIVGVALNKPVVTTIRGEDMSRAQSRLLDRLLLKVCLALSHRVVTVSEEFCTTLKKQYAHYADKVILIENGVGEEFIRASQRRKYTEEKLKLITVSSLIRRKGVKTIIYALANASDKSLTLTIVGDGPEHHELVNLCTTLNLTDRVDFKGALNPDAIAPLFQQHHIFLLASYSEGRPNVVLEAMAAAMPIIATDIPGTNEIILDQQTGLLFPPDDHDALARKIDLLTINTSLRENLGRAAKAYIQTNGLLWPQSAQKYIQMYYDITDS